MKKLSLLIAVIALFSTAVQAEVLRERARVRANNAAVAGDTKVVVVNPDADTSEDDSDEVGTATVTTTDVDAVGAARRANINNGAEVNINERHTARNAGAVKHKKDPSSTR